MGTTETPTHNPFLPTTSSGKEDEPADEIAKLETKPDSSAILVPPPNPYLPGAVNDTSEDKGFSAHIPTTPMMHTRPPAKADIVRDEENFEGVIKHDPDLKTEI